MCNTTGDNPYLNYLNNYFGNENGDNPVCREERQYALFLYNKLLGMVDKQYKEIEVDKDKEIFCKIFGFEDDETAEKSNIVIKNVYYEVTFMRDFFYKEKNNSSSDFNKNLFEYVLEKFKGENNCLSHLFKINENTSVLEIIESQHITVFPKEAYNNYNNVEKYKVICDINYGSNAKDGEKTNILPCFIRKFMRSMMNSKPDIGIIFEKQDKKYLKFIECKYLSPEGYVKLIEIKVYQNMKKDNLFKDFSFIIPQTVIQYFIADFICNKILKGSGISPDSPSIVKFGELDNDDDIVKEYNNNESYFYRPDNIKIIESKIDIKDLVPVCLLKLDIFSNND